MSSRSIRRAPQNRKEFALGIFWSLLLAFVVAAVAWFLLDGLPGALAIGAIGVGDTLGYAFSHGQRRFRNRLRPIGSRAVVVGVILFACSLVLGVALGGQTLFEGLVVYLLLPGSGLLLFFGLSLQEQDKRLHPPETTASYSAPFTRPKNHPARLSEPERRRMQDGE